MTPSSSLIGALETPGHGMPVCARVRSCAPVRACFNLLAVYGGASWRPVIREIIAGG
jgi:hypothetical protein